MTIKVFIVEDDPMVMSINKEYTEKVAHFEVIGTSTNQQEAFQKIKDLKPDLILLDIYLPKGNGVTLLKQIRQSKLPVDIILVTAAKDSVTVLETFRYGVIDYLIKPFGFERLKQALTHYYKLSRFKDEGIDLNQEDLDNLKAPSNANQAMLSSLPKGVQSITVDQILDYLAAQKQGLSCNQIAAGLTLSKITAWRYLEYLVDKGKVDVELDHGSVGRPTKKYLISKSSRLTRG